MTRMLSSAFHIAQILLLLEVLYARADYSCVRDCTGMANGDYPSCESCHKYVKCTNERLHTMRCYGKLQFDNIPDSNNIKHCVAASRTCTRGAGGCPPGYTIRFRNSCYYVSSNTDIYWAWARQGCLAVGAHLVEVNDVDEQNYLASVLDVMFPDPPATATNVQWWGVWTAATDAATEGTWVWEHSNSPLSYTNWKGGEPNNAGNEDCSTMVRALGWVWNDRKCHLADLGYMCEKELS